MTRGKSSDIELLFDFKGEELLRFPFLSFALAMLLLLLFKLLLLLLL